MDIIRTSISVPVDLDHRMKSAGRLANWSAVARAAFTSTLTKIASKKAGGMMDSAVVERLRDSRKRGEAKRRKLGQTNGAEWAKSWAEAE